MGEAIDKLEEGLYEVCPRCEGRCQGCTVCWDQGLVPHQCPAPDSETDET